MALNSLYRITFKNSSNSGFVSGDKVITYWDDVALQIVAYKNGSPLSSGVALGVSQYRPVRRSLVINYVVNNEPINAPVYQFCNGATLVNFKFISIFPYSQKIEYPNNASCITGIVCDLEFSANPQTIAPSTESATDGQITVLATGSNGAARYSLDDVLYSQMTNTTGVFTGLGEGAYIVYAADQYNCTKSISVILEVSDVYGILYRLEYTDQQGVETRIDILERDFSGDITEIYGSDTPLVLNLRGENDGIFTPILPSDASIGLTSRINFEFLNLFTQDDRKYRVIFYKDESGFTEYWRGYITPSLYTEQYVTDNNYNVTAEATDQLSYLKSKPFVDKSGNSISGDLSLIKIIAIILSYTDLDLNIRSCISIYEIDMDTTADDDPLEQTYINALTYKNGENPLNCYETLSNILLSFGSRIFQWKGFWYIIPVDFYTGDEITFREFDTNGDYVSNGSFSPVIDIKVPNETNRAAWTGRSQNLEVRAAYGRADINYNLNKVDFGVKNGGFESVKTAQIITAPRGTPRIETAIIGYDNWTLNLNGNIANLPPVVAAFPNLGSDKIISNGKERNNLYSGALISNSNNTVYGQDAYLQSTPNDIIFSDSDWIRIKFDFFVGAYGAEAIIESLSTPPTTKFKFSFKLENYYLRSDGGWNTDSDFEWIEVNVERGSFGSWKTIDIKAQCPPVTGEVVSSYYFKLMHGASEGSTWDFTSSSDLQALPTVDLQEGSTAYVHVPGVVGNINRYYRLETSTATTSDPDRLRPSDYNGTTNKVVWIKFEEFSTSMGVKDITIRNFDNVSVEFLPQGQVSPDEHIESFVNSTRIKENYETIIINGDAPSDVSNAKNIYFNYYKYQDGTPTVSWNRMGVSEGYSLLSLLAKRIIDLHSKPKFKITGTLVSDVFFGFYNSFLEDYTGKYYIIMGMSLNDKRREYTVENQEVDILTSTGILGIGEFNEEEFNIEFDI